MITTSTSTASKAAPRSDGGTGRRHHIVPVWKSWRVVPLPSRVHHQLDGARQLGRLGRVPALAPRAFAVAIAQPDPADAVDHRRRRQRRGAVEPRIDAALEPARRRGYIRPAAARPAASSSRFSQPRRTKASATPPCSPRAAVEGGPRLARPVPCRPRRRLGEVAGEQGAGAPEIGEVAEPRVGGLLRPHAEREQGDARGGEHAEDEQRDEQLDQGEAVVLPRERGGGHEAWWRGLREPLHPLRGPPPRWGGPLTSAPVGTG